MRLASHRTLTLAALVLLAGASLLGGLASGEWALGPAELWSAFTGASHSTTAEVVRELRVPRVVGTFACGGLLALAGTLMQALLRNPLADPYVLGLSGGAAVGALLAMLAGAAVWMIDLSALVGALVVMMGVLGLAHAGGAWTPTRLLLTGVIISSGCAALIAFVLSVAPASQLPGMLFWLMGDAANISRPLPPVLLLVTATVALIPVGRELNLLARGSLTAQALGVPVPRLRLAIYLVASLLTAISVSTVGAVGFVGLVVPHVLRLLGAADHRVLLPAAALLGGSVLTVADTLARTVMSPVQLPVGVLMAFIGVPVFLLLLHRAGAAR